VGLGIFLETYSKRVENLKNRGNEEIKTSKQKDALSTGT